MVYHPVGVHVVEVVLEIRQKQGAHAHRVDEHVLGALNGEEPDIDAKADEAVRSIDLVGTHIIRQEQLAAVLEIERLAGGIQFRQGVEKVGVQVGPLQSRKRRRQHICRNHLILALSEDPVPVLLAVPHLAQEKLIEAFALELVALHHHQLYRTLSVLKFRDMLQCGKARRLFIVAEALHRPDMLFHHVGHGCFIRHRHRFFEQHLNEIGTAGGDAFFIIQVLLEHLIAHTCFSLSLMASLICLLTVSM